jgi:single-strand DNA-binding protein
MRSATLIGRLIANPELRYTPGGTAVCNFTLRVSERQGEVWESHDFPVVAWGRGAERLCKQGFDGAEVVVIAKAQSVQVKSEETNRMRRMIEYKADWLRVCMVDETTT